jgi:hypothetical protein
LNLQPCNKKLPTIRGENKNPADRDKERRDDSRLPTD